MRYDLDELRLDFSDAHRLRETLHEALTALAHYAPDSDHLDDLGALYAGAVAAEARAFEGREESISK